MPKLTPITLAAEGGYDVTGVKGGGSDEASYTLEKDGRKLIVDQALLDDVTRRAAPVENPDADARIKAVAS